jgi:hypothetical protein
MIRLAFSLLSFLFVSALSANAMPIVLDQFSFVSGSSLNAANGLFNAPANGVKELAQTFTVNNTGVLTEVDLGLSPQGGSTGDLLFDIRDVVNGVPVEDDSLALVFRDVPRADITCSPDCNRSVLSVVDLGLSVSTGENLAIVLRAAVDGAYTWDETGVPYSSGIGYLRSPGQVNTWMPLSDTQPISGLAFQTYVDCADPSNCNPAVPQPIPEPSSIILFCIGLIRIARFRNGRSLGVSYLGRP